MVSSALERFEIPLVAAKPLAHCVCAGFESSAIRYVVYYWLTDLKAYLETDSRVRVHVYAALGRAGMEIPISRSDLYLHSARTMAATMGANEQKSRVELLRSLELFAPLTDDETHALATQLTPTPFAPSDIATRQGEPSDSLYILARGEVAIFRDGEHPKQGRKLLAKLTAPAFFGEMGLLTGQARTATIIAECRWQSRAMGRQVLADLLQYKIPALQQAGVDTSEARTVESAMRPETRAAACVSPSASYSAVEVSYSCRAAWTSRWSAGSPTTASAGPCAMA